MTDEGAAVLPGPHTTPATFRPRTAYAGFRAFGSGDGAVLLAQGVVRRLRSAAELAAGEGRAAGGLLYGRPWDDDQGSYVVVTGFLEAGPGENPGREDSGGRPGDGAGEFTLSPAGLRLLRADAARMYSASVEVGWWRTLDRLGEFGPGDFVTQAELVGPDGVGLLVYGSGPHWGTAYLGPDGAAPDCAGTLVATGTPAGDSATTTDAEPEDPFVTATTDGPDDPFVTAVDDGPDDPFAAATEVDEPDDRIPAAGDEPADPFTGGPGTGRGSQVPAGTGREPRKPFVIASLARERQAEEAASARTRRSRNSQAGPGQTGPSQAGSAQSGPAPTRPLPAVPSSAAPLSVAPSDDDSLDAGQAAAGTGPTGARPGTVVATRRRASLTPVPRPAGPRVISPMPVSTDEWRVKRPHPGYVGPETPTDVKLVVGGIIIAFIIVAVIIGVLFSNALIAVVAGVVFMLVVFGFVWMSRL